MHNAPGYALLLAPLWGVSGGELTGLMWLITLMHLGLGGLWLALVWRWMGRRLGTGTEAARSAGLLAGLTVVNAGYLQAQRMVLSEPLFLVLLTGGALLVDGYAMRRRGGWALAGGLACGCWPRSHAWWA